MLRVDDRLVGADDRVDVLEEDDPGRDLVRPADALRLLLVLPEVAGGVEELLRHDGRTQLDCVRLEDLACLSGGPPRLEVRAHRRDLELDDLVVSQVTDPAFVEGDELHSATPQTRWAARA